MNHPPGRSIAAPASSARTAEGESRPHEAVEAILAALALLLAALLGAPPGTAFARAVAAQAVACLRAWLRPRARAATPEQHARALRHLRAMNRVRHLLPRRTPRIRPSRAARRRIAECFRMLVNPRRRRASFPRPTSARPHPGQAPHAPRHPHLAPRARPPPRIRPPNAPAFACPYNATL